MISSYLLLAVLGQFSIIVLPDTQHAVAFAPQIFARQMQWISDNAETLNVRGIVHLGDWVDVPNDTVQWQRVRDTLTAEWVGTGIPLSPVMGNHDDPNNSTLFNLMVAGQQTPFLGYPTASLHNCVTMSDPETKLLFVAIGYWPDMPPCTVDDGRDAAVMCWLRRMVTLFPDWSVIISTHAMIDCNGNWTQQGQRIYTAVRDCPNVILMLGGHFATANGSCEALRSDTYNGHTIYTMLSDYQNCSGTGEGWLRLLTFDATTIHVQTYSPWLDAYQTDSDSRFDLPRQ